jgi:nicotinamidase-related amidase
MSLSAASHAALSARSQGYLDYLERWLGNRLPESLTDIIARADGVERVAIVSVDLIVGFCHTGPLSSPRVAAILPAVRELMILAHTAGVTKIAVAQDTHREDAEEFASFPPHCVAGTLEAEMVDELASLPFSPNFRIIQKNSISSLLAPEFADWEQDAGDIHTYIVVGDCTDLCVYQAALALKTRSNSEHRGQRVMVPVNCVATYDMPVSTALEFGTEPHDGDLLHHVFLHSMALNGVDVVADVTP